MQVIRKKSLKCVDELLGEGWPWLLQIIFNHSNFSHSALQSKDFMPYGYSFLRSSRADDYSLCTELGTSNIVQSEIVSVKEPALSMFCC